MHCFILVALPQTENKANSIVKAVKAHVEYTNEVSMCSYVCHHSGSISYPFGYITLHCGQGKVGVVTCRVLCTWQLISLAVKGPWLALGGPILTLCSYMNGLRKCYSHLIGGSLLAGKAVWVLNVSLLVNEWPWLKSQVCLLCLKVHLGSVLEPGIRQKWCIKGMYMLLYCFGSHLISYIASSSGVLCL